MRIRLPWQPKRAKFTGDWADRLDSLFSCGVEFSGGSILDLGCNMGVVAYEVAKHKPASIHGIDHSSRHIEIAKSIFEAIPVQSRFESMDISGRQFAAALKPSYDIVLLLAVYHHVRNSGVERAQAAMHEVAARCTSTIVVRDPGHTEEEVVALFGEHGFCPSYRSEKPERIGRLTVLSRN